jgi:hypothetical protein
VAPPFAGSNPVVRLFFKIILKIKNKDIINMAAGSFFVVIGVAYNNKK